MKYFYVKFERRANNIVSSIVVQIRAENPNQAVSLSQKKLGTQWKLIEVLYQHPLE